MSVALVSWFSAAAWFAASLLLGAAGAFLSRPETPPIPILLGVTLPIAAFVAVYSTSRAFRTHVLSADLRLFAGIQAWRLGGFWFLALYAYDLLPGLFAWPAALGDTAVALAAPWIIVRLSRDPAFAASRAFVR